MKQIFVENDQKHTTSKNLLRSDLPRKLTPPAHGAINISNGMVASFIEKSQNVCLKLYLLACHMP